MNSYSLLYKAITKAQGDRANYEEIAGYDIADRKNEFLLFIKPEFTLPGKSIAIKELLNLIDEKRQVFDLSLKSIHLLGAPYLKEYQIIRSHYGVISRLAQDPNQASLEAKEKFQELFKIPFSSAKVIGGSTFLTQLPSFTPNSLDILWQNLPVSRLAGGTYCAPCKAGHEHLYIVNGFLPKMVDYYTQAGRSIIVIHLTGDLDWKEARQAFVGATNPAEAQPGSIRKLLFEQQKDLGLEEISQAFNGVHLSAGPLEALAELIRMKSKYYLGELKKATDFSFGKQLAQHFPPEKIEFLLSNKPFTYKGRMTTPFDLTEEKNSDQALAILKEALCCGGQCGKATC